MHELEERIGRLERENRTLKRWGLAALLLVAGLGLLGQAAPKDSVQDVVRTRRLEVVDADGKLRAELFVLPNGAVLGLNDSNEKTRALLGVDADGPSLRLRDSNENGSALLGVAPGGPVLGMLDSDGKMRAGLAMSSTGPSLGLYDSNGTIRAGLSVFARGPSLTLDDSNGMTRVGLGVSHLEATATVAATTTAESSLVLIDRAGKVISQLP